MKLLGVHFDLELEVRLCNVILNLENGDSALIVLDVSLMFPLHFRLSLLTGQLIMLIPFQMIFESLLNNLLDLLFNP